MIHNLDLIEKHIRSLICVPPVDFLQEFNVINHVNESFGLKVHVDYAAVWDSGFLEKLNILLRKNRFSQRLIP